MTTWYIIDRRTNEIINAVEAESYERAYGALARMVDGQHLMIDRNPRREMLERYRYWNERP